jgi:hypothetical protein
MDATLLGAVALVLIGAGGAVIIASRRRRDLSAASGQGESR